MKEIESTDSQLPLFIQVYNKGHECLVKYDKDIHLSNEERMKYLNKAEEIFNKLLNDKKECPILAFSLASVDAKRGNYGRAIALLKDALRQNPNFIDAMNNLGFIFKTQNDFLESRKIFQYVLDLIDKHPELKEENKISDQSMAQFECNLGATFIAQGESNKAIDIFNKATSIYPDCEMAKWNRSLGNLELGNYEKGFDEYDFGDRVIGARPRKYGKEETPFWDGTPGKTIVIFGEQGIGDEIMFASMLPDIIKDNKIILDAHPRLADLFRNSFPGIPIYGTRKEATPFQYSLAWTQFQNIDAKLAIGTLGKFYRKKKEDFPGNPYLYANPLLVEEYKEKLTKLGSRKKIGISWRGGTLSTNKNTRKIKKELLLPLLKCDYDFISLQYDKDIDNEVKEFEERHNIKLNHWSDVLADYDHTAGLVSNLDYIISVPQSVVHLSGALGVPTLQLCPKQALWQMGPYGEDMPWYKCVNNIWQEKAGEWESVIDKAKEKLCSL